MLFISKANASIENDVKKITSILRCMTCQNQTIYDSDADFSKDILAGRKFLLKQNQVKYVG